MCDRCKVEVFSDEPTSRWRDVGHPTGWDTAALVLDQGGPGTKALRRQGWKLMVFDVEDVVGVGDAERNWGAGFDGNAEAVEGTDLIADGCG